MSFSPSWVGSPGMALNEESRLRPSRQPTRSPDHLPPIYQQRAESWVRRTGRDPCERTCEMRMRNLGCAPFLCSSLNALHCRIRDLPESDLPNPELGSGSSYRLPQTNAWCGHTGCWRARVSRSCPLCELLTSLFPVTYHPDLDVLSGVTVLGMSFVSRPISALQHCALLCTSLVPDPESRPALLIPCVHDRS